MSPIDKKNLLADLEELKKSPWFNADYISDERRLGMKEALDMMSSIISHSPTMDAIPVEFIRHWIHALNHGRRNGKVWAAMVLQALLDAWARAERKEETK